MESGFLLNAHEKLCVERIAIVVYRKSIKKIFVNDCLRELLWITSANAIPLKLSAQPLNLLS